MVSSSVVFTFDDMIASLRQAMEKFPDPRSGKNLTYDIMDAASGAFSVFFTQCPSFLSHQELLQQRYGLSNAKTLFGMRDIPSDNHIRNLLDEASPNLLSDVFSDCFTALKKSGHLSDYRVNLGKSKNDLLVALDGTMYFSSSSIHCDQCSTRIKDGEKLFLHSMVTPTLVAPGNSKVISFMPEFITPQDGNTKQDCEIKASKRWLSSTKYHLKEHVTLLGDDLYAHVPFCQDVLGRGFNFIFVCKPDSHKTVYEWTKGITREKTVDRFDGKKHYLYNYKYAEAVPLKDTAKKTEEALLINFVEVTVLERESKKKVYHNAFITNHAVTGKTEQETETLLNTIIDAGRARWKIENENNNTLKRQGYNLEHNFGHGNKYLARVLATMNLLAFLFHTMLEFMDKKYQMLRKVFGARKTFFNHIRTLLVFHPYKSFASLMDFMIEGLKKPFPIEELRYPL